jgi:uncharacterized damage-inducible protein DinB
MFTTSEAFIQAYSYESSITARVLAALTDASLSQSKGPDDDTLGDIAWHTARAVGAIANQGGLGLDSSAWSAKPEPVTAAAIQTVYNANCAALLERAKSITPEELDEQHNFFNFAEFPLRQILQIVMVHEIHHRGQISVLMRQAGLTVPNIYGPNKEMAAELRAKAAAAPQ